MISRLPDNCATLYADLMQEVALYAPATQGAFVSKTIKGSRYWYHQTDSAAGRKQIYLGQKSDALLAEIASRKVNIAAHRELLSERRRLVAMLGVAGAHLEKGRAAKIIEITFRRKPVHYGRCDGGFFRLCRLWQHAGCKDARAFEPN